MGDYHVEGADLWWAVDLVEGWGWCGVEGCDGAVVGNCVDPVYDVGAD